MVVLNSSLTLGFVVATGALLLHAAAADGVKTEALKFTGSPSCASTSCHGGGSGHSEYIIYQSQDHHAFAGGVLGKGTSQRICESLGITGDPTKAAQCNVCHAPMEGVAPDRLTQEARADKGGVGCESCHGPAEKWLRFHTRPDATFQQIVSAGMRDLNDIYNRANTCVGCHLNLDDTVRHAGHPELMFELDGQTQYQPPHYKDERPSLGARQWLTGQATALREISWKLVGKRDDALVPRWKALRWLLRKTELGKKSLPDGEDFGGTQNAADQLAHEAAKTLWSKQQIAGLLKDYTGLHAEFSDAKADKLELRRRAEVLVPAMDRLWRSYKKETGAASDNFEKALFVANRAAMEQDGFDPAKFASTLEQVQVAFAKDVK